MQHLCGMQVALTFLYLYGGNNPLNRLNGMEMMGLKQYTDHMPVPF